MGLLTVDEEKCVKDGVCAEICPMGIIALKKEGGWPVIVPGGETYCISCGHCVSACPPGALSHAVMKAEDCPPVTPELRIEPDRMAYWLRSRRSIRRFQEKPVDREILFRLIDMVRFAPSGHNLQPVRWLVVENADEVKAMAELVIDWMRTLIEQQDPLAEMFHFGRIVAAWKIGRDPILRNAPHLILAYGHNENRAAPSSCTIALTQLELAAPSLGLGACWAGYFNTAANIWKPLQERLDLPEGNITFGAMMVGWPKFQYHRLPKRKPAQIHWR